MNVTDVDKLADSFAGISLEELVGQAALLTRLDNKYLVPRDAFAELVSRLGGDYLALDIDGRRCFAYDTVYFDGQQLPSYYAHLQRRRKRFKARSRHYLDSSRCVLEIKLRGGRGETVKRQLAWDPALHGQLTPAGRAFLELSVQEAYGRPTDAVLSPMLHTSYRRLTIVHRELAQRLTCDFDLLLSGTDRTARMDPELVLVESKSELGRGVADLLLHRLRLHPINASKYCLGIALTRPDIRNNDFRHVLRHFQAVRSTRPQWTVARPSAPRGGEKSLGVSKDLGHSRADAHNP